MQKKFIMALDQGTTSSRTIIFDKAGQIIASAQKEFQQIYPQPGWVEHNPEELLKTQMETIKEAISVSQISVSDIEAIGIANQRETTVVWDKETGKPIYNAIVWQCRRTAEICEELKANQHEDYIKNATGLVIDAYFSATKLHWILENVEGAREKAENGSLKFGTIDTWLIWNLTGGKIHATDYSNASRTMMYDIHHLCWDEKILRELDIPTSMLPEVKDSSGLFGYAQILDGEIPITGVAGDQQASLFGQACFRQGDVKSTYGTGCFMLVNTGKKPVDSKQGLITTIAWGMDGTVEYALEGSVFIAGAAIQWIRDELQLIDSSEESEAYAQRVKDNGGVYFIPAFVGLGAPHWKMNCRGTITGLSRGTNKYHIVRAALESIAYQVKDVLMTVEKDEGVRIKEIKVDGGAAENDFLMQFQSDILNIAVERPWILETTALGAAYFAGLYTGYWSDKCDIESNRKVEKKFTPNMGQNERDSLYDGWVKNVAILIENV